MAKVLLDLRCDNCEHVVEDEYAEGGQGSYGTCGKCAAGTMRQIFSTGGFTLGSVANIKGKSGRTADGTKWEVGSKLSKYSARKGEFTGEL